jgi:hypothetical protein
MATTATAPALLAMEHGTKPSHGMGPYFTCINGALWISVLGIPNGN